MRSGLDGFVEEHLPLIETELRYCLPQSSLPGTEALNQAVCRAVFSGGKRTRPLLTLLAASLFDTPPSAALRAACGVEFLHTSSMIFDDLPSMDNAETRRHLPALHVACGEGIAILAALALYTKTYEIFAGMPGLVEEVARAVGCDGMIGGQAADLLNIASSRLEKTTALTRFAVSVGGRTGGTNQEQIVGLERYGTLVGEAYQICDDLLDVLGTESVIGKTVGQDSRHGRGVLTPDFGVDRAFARAQELIRQAKDEILGRFAARYAAALLCEFADQVTGRLVGLVQGHDNLPLGSGAASASDVERRAVAARTKGRSFAD